MLALLLLACPSPGRAQDGDAGTGSAGTQSVEETIDRVIGELDFSQLEGLTVPGMEEADVAGAVRRFASGETVSVEALVSDVLSALFAQLDRLGPLLLSLMLPMLLLSILSHLLLGENDTLAGLAHSACFVLLLIPMITLTIRELEHTRSAIVAMTTQMDKMLPLLLTLLTAVGGSASTAFVHPVVVAASGSMV